MDVALVVRELHLVMNPDIFVAHVVYHDLLVVQCIGVKGESKRGPVDPIEDLFGLGPVARRPDLPTDDLLLVPDPNHPQKAVLGAHDSVRFYNFDDLYVSLDLELRLREHVGIFHIMHGKSHCRRLGVFLAENEIIKSEIEKLDAFWVGDWDLFERKEVAIAVNICRLLV